MTKSLKTLTLSAALAAMFLSAGAFAGASSPQPMSKPMSVKANVTIIHKNSQWPIKGQITSDVCAVKRCIAI